jgi:glycosyltransferase involved in cell wall biosynthesis
MNQMETTRIGIAGDGEGNGSWIVHLSTYPPRKCGIATFTKDLLNAMDDLLAANVETRVVAMNASAVLRHHYPGKVIHEISHERENEYVDAAKELNQQDTVKLVNVQHEFGIFGGDHGLYLLPFLQTLKKPKVINFHTVLPDPDEELLSVVRSLDETIDGITVMTTRSRRILEKDYGVPSNKIWVIPHGIHSQSYAPSNRAKAALGFGDMTVFSTFGLLNRGKGLEYVIEALPQIIRRFPKIVYIIFGATHPVTLREEGEAYRNSLIQSVYDLGLEDHVKFYNRYLPLRDLLRLLKATDVYISPSLDPNQAVSGTLSYALGMGRPVISTAFAQAKEDITDEVGLLVDFMDTEAYAHAMIQLLENPDMQQQLGRNAYFRTRRMTWPNVAIQYCKVYSSCAPDLAEAIEERTFPKVKLDYLSRLTTNFGIVQFARLTKPEFSSGYTLDDNARALMAVALYYDQLRAASPGGLTPTQKTDLSKLMDTYLRFVESVSNEDGGFINYVRTDGTADKELNKRHNLEDANGRAMYSLAVTATIDALPKNTRRRALELLEQKMGSGISIGSPRAIALYAKSLCALLEKGIEIDDLNLEQLLRDQCNRLMRLYEESSSHDWKWFELYLTYSNAVLPEALLLGGKLTGEDSYLDVGKQSLDFLVSLTFTNEKYMPIGQDGWHVKGRRRTHFDQQPEDVAAMVSALKTAFLITKDDNYRKLMYRAFYWFLGDNSLNQVVYDRTTGGCYDGVGRSQINLNQGAESTISYLLARLAF